MRIFVDTVLVLDNSTVGMSSFHSSQGLLLCVCLCATNMSAKMYDNSISDVFSIH